MERGLVVERVAQLIKVFLFRRGITLRGVPRGKVLKRAKIHAGDYVRGELPDGETFAIEEVEERKNLLVRPPIANVDRVICVMTIQKPEFDNYLLDNLLVVYDHVGCEPVIVFNKVDIINEEGLCELRRWTEIYSKAGYDVVHVSARTGKGLDKVKELVKG